MGSFNDNRSAARETWRFAYKGKDLLPFVQTKLAFFARREMDVRNILATRLADPGVKANSDKNESLRKKIESFGAEREKCLVWQHECTRNLEMEFVLGLGDVTYFDIASIPSAEDPDID